MFSGSVVLLRHFFNMQVSLFNIKILQIFYLSFACKMGYVTD
jgi:hypothetical protein